MADDEHKDPVATARRLITLIASSIANENETKSLALTNSRAELSFQLKMTLLELGNDRTLSQNNERLSACVRPLLETLGNLVSERRNRRLKMEGSPYQAALARIFCDEADPPELSLVRLPQTAEELRTVAQKISSFRNPNYSRHNAHSDLEGGRDRAGTCHRTTARDGSHASEADKSEGEKEYHSVKRARAEPPRSGRDAVTVEPQSAIQSRPQQQQLSYKQSTAREFMGRAQTFYQQKMVPLKKKKAIKVAVLDTGVDEGEIHFKAVRGPRGTSIRLAKSFIGGSPHDTDGHGTRVAALVVEMAPHVDLYIAKVCNGKEIYVVDQYVEAINWAIELKVHIINISAAIDETEGIYNAIEKAEAQGIIVFAAASNSGANARRAFPANMDKVLAIHATDGHGNPSKMNPSPMNHHHNFSTLGESIPSPLKGGGYLPPGTSFSTPIAAGMAANMLTLAVECLGESEKDKALRRFAFKRAGVLRIFNKASQDRCGYNYVCPSRVAEDRDAVDEIGGWLREALKEL